MNYVSKGKTIAATIIGNVIEWYDFAIYGNFALAGIDSARLRKAIVAGIPGLT